MKAVGVSKQTVDASRNALGNLQEVSDMLIALLQRSLTKTLYILRGGIVICVFGAHLLLSACAGGGGGSSNPGSPSSPPDASPTEPGNEPDSAPPPPSSPPPPSGTPPGPLSIPLGSSLQSNLAPVEQATLRFGGAFGAGPDLGRVVAVDSLGRPHWIDLGGRTRAAEPSLDLLDWLSPSNQRFSLSGRVTPQFALGLDVSARAASALSENRQYENDEFANSFALAADFAGARLSLLRDWDMERLFGFSAEAPAEEYNLIGISAFASPHLSLMGAGDGLVLAQEIGESVSLRFGYATERSARSTEARGDAKVWSGEVIGRHANGSWIGLQLGSTLEGNRLLGSEGNGAFELPPTSTTLFTGLAGSLYVTDRLELFGQASLGFTDPAGSSQGLLRDVSALRSSSFGFGIAHRELLAANDRLTLALSQPLRVDAGTAIFDRAVGWSPDGRILRQRERISLEPEGRETDIEVGYRFPLGGNANMSFNWLSQLEPGHNRDASPAHTLALKLRAKF